MSTNTYSQETASPVRPNTLPVPAPSLPVRVKDDAVLRPGLLTPRSKLRATVPTDGFRFGIRAGLDLITRPDPHLLFAVALSVADAIDHTITALPASIAGRAVVHEQLYLAIRGPKPGSPTSAELNLDQHTQYPTGPHPKE